MSAGMHVVVAPGTRPTGKTGVVEAAGVAGMDRAAGAALMRATASDIREAAPRLDLARAKSRRLIPFPPQDSGAAPPPQPYPTVVHAWIGAGPGLNEPAGFAVDLDRVLTVLPRRNFPPANLSGPQSRLRQRKGRGRWSGGPFGGMAWPSMSRIWARGKGRRR